MTSPAPKHGVEHTPTPWQISGSHERLIVTGLADGYNEYSVAESRFHRLISPEEAAANAAFIVEAVNSHASLKADNERLRKALRDISETKLWHRDAENAVQFEVCRESARLALSEQRG